VQAQNLLHSVEKECSKVGLAINAKKTKGLPLGFDDPVPLHTTEGTELDWVERYP
jgi:hypothetical protein